MDESSPQHILKLLEQREVDLDKVCVSGDENIKLKVPTSEKLSISSWMKVYKDAETSKERKNLREIAINITGMFGCSNVVSEHGTFTSKFELSSPYNFFLTTVARLEETFKQSNSLSFHEIIDYTGGEIVDSLHINHMLDLLWLATEYMLAAQYPTMTVICGSLKDPVHKSQIPFDITIVEVELPEFGCHHSKISILKYKNNSIRIIISNANLHRPDWEQWTQGLWVSPILPPLLEDAEDSNGDSVTHFKKDFMDYLNVYQQPELNEWKSVICRTDCSDVKVFFFASAPQYNESNHMDLWGHKRLYRILEKHATLPDNAKDWPIVAQCSGVGIYGGDYHSWLSTHIVHSMAKEKNKRIIHLPEFRFLYPSSKTFENSFDKQTHVTPLLHYEDQLLKQRWMEDYFYKWTFEKTGRTRAMPHCKSYTRISPDETEIAWFILSSANLTKCAWGKMIRGGRCLSITNYEAGVLFIPEIMINQTTFPIKESSDLKVPVFLLPYDVPMPAYEPGTKPFLMPGSRPMGKENEEKDKSLKEKLVEQKEIDDRLIWEYRRL